MPEIRARLEELGMAEDEEFLACSLLDFMQSTRELLDAMQEQKAAGNAGDLVRSAHRLAGAAITLGAERLSELSRAVEHRRLGGDASVLSADLEALVGEGEEVLAFCRVLMPSGREAEVAAALGE